MRDRPLEKALADPPQEGYDYRHFTRSQSDILRDPISGSLIVDQIIRFESLQSDYNRICDRLGKPRINLGRLNIGKRQRDWRPYFTEKARKLAEAMFEEDLTRFGYTF